MPEELEKSTLRIRDLSSKETLDSLYSQKEDPWHTRTMPEKIVRYRELEKLLPLKPVDSALEIACGEGDFAEIIARRAKKVVGMDISEEVLKRVRLKYPGIGFFSADVKELTAEFFSKFDLIVWLDSICFLTHKESQDVIGRIFQGIRGRWTFLLFSSRIVPATGTEMENWESHDFSDTYEFITHIKNIFPSATPVPVQLNFNIYYPEALNLFIKSHVFYLG